MACYLYGFRCAELPYLKVTYETVEVTKSKHFKNQRTLPIVSGGVVWRELQGITDKQAVAIRVKLQSAKRTQRHQQAFKALGIVGPRLNIASCRTAFAQNLMELGCPIWLVGALLGHSAGLQTTEKYTQQVSNLDQFRHWLEQYHRSY